ncbi:hypothetical protein niasHT_007813 [Heterodera trifolii]|uniref:Transcription initiation factor TFIID subunit 2 n=1 Tax=Heterodera trifolii TaxID=157864 RepID=A0ABD2LKP8_9BILA
MVTDKQASYRLLSQSVQIFDINFDKSSFRVSTDLSLIALRSDLTEIVLNLGDHCILPNQPNFKGEGRVSINDIDANYLRRQTALKGTTAQTIPALMDAWNDLLQSRQGCLIVYVPNECLSQIRDQIVVSLHIDIIVCSPKQGIKFVFTRNEENDDGLPSGAHLFTYRSNPQSSTKEWLPCSEEPLQLCVWRFEITVPKQLTAVCCGDLIDTIPNSDDDSLKTLCYQLLVPTSAANIGFAIGDFQIHVQPEMPEIINFVVPELIPLLKHTMKSLNRIFVFFEELLSCRFPYSTYWQIFVDQTPDEVTSFAGLTIFSIRLLYHKKILDMVQGTRKLLATAIAQQFFGCFIAQRSFNELWLLRGLSGFLTGVFVERFFGATESNYQLNKLLKDSCEYEARFGAIALRPNANHSQFFFDPNCPETCSPFYLDALFRKGHLVIRMLEKRLPKEQFVKVLQRILSLGVQYSQNLDRPVEWTHMLINTAMFLRVMTDVTGKELPSFVEQWIDFGGFVNFQVSHTFNRKRNIIELELRQTVPLQKGCQNYTGPLTIVVQELEGHFAHTIQIDAAVSRHDIQCHSKGRKLKKKRIMLGTGEEVDVDLNSMDFDSPVLWIRVDPNLLLYRQLSINQPFYQWELMLLHERDVLAQQQAIETLCRFSEHKTKILLEETVRNDKFFYRIRREAAHCLVQIYNSLPESRLGESPPLIDYFRQNFGSKTSPDIPLPNNYAATSSNLQNNLLGQALPAAIGSIRGQDGRECPEYVLEFIINLIRLNDNSTNRYSDDYYRGALIHALGKTLTMSERTVEQPDCLSVHARGVLREVTHALNMDTMRPSFGRIISIHCIQVLYELQKLRHLPIDTDIFWKFGQCKGIYAPLRLTALACLVAMIRRSRNQSFIGTILRLVELVANDPDPFVRHSVAQRLCVNPPFEWTENTLYPLNTKRLADLLWGIISDVRTETRIRTSLTDLYFTLYGLLPPPSVSPHYLLRLRMLAKAGAARPQKWIPGNYTSSGID